MTHSSKSSYISVSLGFLNNFNTSSFSRIVDFCTYAVDSELWTEVPCLWGWIAEIISWSIMCDTKDVEGERPSLRDFKGAFIAAEKDTRKKHALLASTLYRLVSFASFYFILFYFFFDFSGS